MKRPISLMANVVLGAVIGCANVAGVGDYKKEGEDGKALGAECVDVTECGAGLTCAGSPSTCLRNCFDLAKPSKSCGQDGCFPLTSGTAAVCFPTGTNQNGTCTTPFDCAPGFDCVQLIGATESTCVPWCQQGSNQCTGGTVCNGRTPAVTIEGAKWGGCGPPG